MSKRKYAVCGLGIGLTQLLSAFFAMGAGHGSYIPYSIFFAPLLFLGFLYDVLDGAFNDVLNVVAFLAILLLYPTYALALRWGRLKHKEISVLLVLLLIHFSAVGVSAYQGWDYEYFEKLWRASKFMTVLVFVPFALTISLAFYVVLRPPKTQDEFERCGQCGYNLTGNVSGVCPECGTPI